MNDQREGFRIFGMTLPFGAVIQIVIILATLVGAWYTMKLQIEGLNGDVRDFIDKEHVRTLSEIGTIEQRQQDVRERLGKAEERQSDIRERLATLEQRIFGFNNGNVDRSDERWYQGGRAHQAEKNDGTK